MGSTFFGFNIARSGLFASQRALNITGHNISNANTEGYSRQRLNIVQSSPMSLPNGQGMIGTGVNTDSIHQIRNEFLDMKYRHENTIYGEWDTKSDMLLDVENILGMLNEASKTEDKTVLDKFFGALQDLSTDAGNGDKRTNVREWGVALAKTLNHMANQFEKLQSDADLEIRTTVDDINSYAEQIKDLNESIYRAEMDGSKANDLRDQRNLLVDKLSEITQVDAYEDGQNRFNVLVGGTALVSHFRTTKLTYEQRTTKLNQYDVENLHDIKWENGNAFSAKGGKIKSLIDMRDNVSGGDKGVPYYMKKLNEFTDTFAKRINDVHKAGVGLNNSTGLYFFTVNGKDSATFDPLTETITAKDITISKDIEDSLDNIAASDDPDELPENGKIALSMANIRDESTLFTWGTPEDYIRSLNANVGVDTQQANRMRDNQEVILKQVETNKLSISGVSLDEEMTNMIQFQHSFNANSRMITAMDEMIETIISRMGLVGR